MDIKNKDLRIVFYAIAIFSYSVLLTNIANVFGNISNVLKIVTFFSLSCIFILNIKREFKFNIYSLIKIIGVSGLIIWSFLSGFGELEIVLILLTMLVCININENDLLKAYAVSIFVLLAITVFLCSINVIPNNVDSFGRNTLGFKFTTFSFNLFFTAILAYFSSNKVIIKPVKIFFLFIVAVYLYYKTNTLSAFVLSTIFLLFILVTRVKKEKNSEFKINSFAKKIIINLPIIIAIITISFQIYYNENYNNSVMIELNKLLSGRLYLGKKAFTQFNITLFGQKTLWNFNNNGNYLYVDSSYLNILFSYGIVTLGLVCFAFREILKYTIEKRYYYLCIAIVFFLIHSIADPQLLTLRYDPFLSLYFGVVIKNLKMIKEKKVETI